MDGRFTLSGDDSTEDLALMAKPFEKKVSKLVEKLPLTLKILL
jgi:hypothetical protein